MIWHHQSPALPAPALQDVFVLCFLIKTCFTKVEGPGKGCKYPLAAQFYWRKPNLRLIPLFTLFQQKQTTRNHKKYPFWISFLNVRSMPNPQGSLRKGLNFVVALIIKDIVLLVQTELVLTTIFIYYSRAVLSESESIVF